MYLNTYLDETIRVLEITRRFWKKVIYSEAEFN